MSPLTEPTKLTLAKGQPVPVDLFRSQVSLLLHGDGANGSTTITDSSPTPKTLTSTATNSATEKKYGAGSIYFSGSASIAIPLGADFDFGTSDLTIEAFVFLVASNGPRNIFSQRTAASNGLSFRVNDGRLDFFIDNAGTGSTVGATTLSTPTWHHVALVRQGVTFKIWLNGNLDATSASISASLTSLQQPIIGGRPGAGENFSGYIDELRVTKGVARYVEGTGANAGKMVFAGTNTLALPTAPFPDF